MIQLPSSFYGVETEAQRLRSARVTSWEVAETRFEPLHLCSCLSEAQHRQEGVGPYISREGAQILLTRLT